MKRKHLIIGGVLILASVTTFALVNKSRKKKMIKQINNFLEGATNDPNADPKSVSKNLEKSSLPEGQFPLKFADKNKKVARLQQAINKKYNAGIDVDGKFGQSTASALCKYYFKTCVMDAQSRTYYVENEDYNKINS